MASPDRVSPEEVASVFRRAAELEAAGPRGESGGMLDDRALEDIGREVGLSPASIRAALVELRGGALTPGSAVRWGTVSASRTVVGVSHDVVAAIDDEARRNQLGVVRRVDDATVWARSSGTSATVARSLRGRHHHPLLALEELRATVVELPSPPGLVRVRLEGSLVVPWRLLSPGGQALAVIGVGGGLLLGLTNMESVAALPDWQFDLTGVLGAIAGTGVGLRSYRQTVVATEAALDTFLHRLAIGDLGSPAPPAAL